MVTLTSAAWRSGTIDFDDLDWRLRPYSRGKSYGDSKLANLLFMRALQTRFDDAGAEVLSLAAHPGLISTERQQSIGVGDLIASSVDRGVRPQLRAATDPAAGKRDVYGPRFGLRGPAGRVSVSGKAVDDALAERLWRVTEEITGVRYAAFPVG